MKKTHLILVGGEDQSGSGGVELRSSSSPDHLVNGSLRIVAETSVIVTLGGLDDDQMRWEVDAHRQRTSGHQNR